MGPVRPVAFHFRQGALICRTLGGEKVRKPANETLRLLSTSASNTQSVDKAAPHCELFSGTEAPKVRAANMFQWNTFWQEQRRKSAQTERPKRLGGLRELPGELFRVWPANRSDKGYFPWLLFWVKLILAFFLSWVVTDWFFPVNLLVSIPLAVVLCRFVFLFTRKIRGG